MNRKAVALLSGGLDSTLAVRMMIDQGVEVTAVHFTSVFCNCTPKKAGCRLQARKIAEEFDIPIQVIHKGMDYIRMVERPPHGHGSGMNPCIDCRIYMLRKVKEMMPRLEVSFVITGEVLGQRPMSQHRNTLRLIERESGLEDLILRPLSAHHFDPTFPEREGIVNREKLLAMSGRSRKPQMEMARKLDIRDYPCPAGGCLLTDKEIAARLHDLFTHVPDYDMVDLHFLKLGRHFRLNPGLKVIVGRDHEDNEKIMMLAKPGSILYTPSGFRGPTAVIRGTTDKHSEMAIGRIIARYSQDQHPEYHVRKSVVGGNDSVFVIKERFPADTLDACRIWDRYKNNIDINITAQKPDLHDRKNGVIVQES
ncbi:MAG: 7-cyano-7-deazaguanine synthase [Deltaproteobacteria bacterium]